MAEVEFDDTLLEEKYDPSEPSIDRTPTQTRERSRSPMENGEQTDNKRSKSPKRERRSGRDHDRRRSRDGDRRDRDRDRGGSGRSMDPRKVYISNVPYEMTWQKIKDLARDHVGEAIKHVEMFESAEGKSRGAGVLELKDRESADQAIEKLNKHEINGRAIIVRELREADVRRHQRQGDKSSKPVSVLNTNFGDRGTTSLMGSGRGGGSMGSSGSSMMMGGGGSQNISSQVLQQLGIDGPVTNQCFVANLDYKVNWRKLKDIFKIAGNVVRAEIKEDKDGKSRGFGTVSFETPFEAVQAISMFNGQQLFDRVMTVKMDRMVDGPSPTGQKLPAGLKGIGMGLGAGGLPMQGGQMSSAMPRLEPLQNQMGMGMGNMSSMGGMSNMGGMGGGMSNLGGGMGDLQFSGGMGGNMGGGNMRGMEMGSSMGGGMSSNMGSMGGGGSLMGNSMSSGMSDMGGMSGMNTSYSSSGMSSSGMGDYGGMNRGGNMESSLMGMGGLGGGMSTMGGGMNTMGMLGSYTTSRSDNDMRRSERRSGGSNSLGTRPGQEGTVIFIKNLPYAVTWKDLKEHFRNVGDVKYAEIMTENGKSRGMGTVRFSTPDQAQRAVDLMHGQRIEGREIIVKIDN